MGEACSSGSSCEKSYLVGLKGGGVGAGKEAGGRDVESPEWEVKALRGLRGCSGGVEVAARLADV